MGSLDGYESEEKKVRTSFPNDPAPSPQSLVPSSDFGHAPILDVEECHKLLLKSHSPHYKPMAPPTLSPQTELLNNIEKNGLLSSERLQEMQISARRGQDAAYNVSDTIHTARVDLYGVSQAIHDKAEGIHTVVTERHTDTKWIPEILAPYNSEIKDIAVKKTADANLKPSNPLVQVAAEVTYLGTSKCLRAEVQKRFQNALVFILNKIPDDDKKKFDDPPFRVQRIKDCIPSAFIKAIIAPTTLRRAIEASQFYGKIPVSYTGWVRKNVRFWYMRASDSALTATPVLLQRLCIPDFETALRNNAQAEVEAGSLERLHTHATRLI